MNGGCGGCVSFDVMPYTAAFAGYTSGGTPRPGTAVAVNPLLVLGQWGAVPTVPGGGWGGESKAADVLDVSSSGDPLAQPAEKLQPLWPKLLALAVGAAVGLTAARFLSRRRRR